MDLLEKFREIELSAVSSLQSYKNSVAKTEASESEMKSSLLALDGIRNEAEYGIRTVLDVLDAEVNYLNASVNLITSQSDEIYNLFSIKAITGDLSIQDIDKNYQNENKIKESKLKFNILDAKSFK
jgi:outer membrane protein TolC